PESPPLYALSLHDALPISDVVLTHHLKHLRAQETHKHCARAQPTDKRRPRHPLEVLHRVFPEVLPVRTRTQPLVQPGPARVPRREENYENGDDEHGYTEEEDRDKAKDIVDPFVLSDRGDYAERDADEKRDHDLKKAELDRRRRPRSDFVQHRLLLRERLAEVKRQRIFNKVHVLLRNALVQP